MPLTTEQKDVTKKIIKNIDNEQIQTLGGYAGTGKSTVIRVLLQILGDKGFWTCAYTGKAANVLRKKGVTLANTIHSTIYSPRRLPNDEVIWDLASRDEILNAGINGFIVDEASMVSKEIHEDLSSFGLPIIYVGDHGQLEPIGTGLNLMQNPMYRLEEVHRNAGEIAHFANHLRNGNPSDLFQGSSRVQIVTRNAVEDRHLAKVDQVICAYNKTRVQINEKVRKEKDIFHTFLYKGEKIICLRNNRKQGLFNGMQGIVKKVYPNERIDFYSDGVFYEKIHYDPDQLGLEKNDFDFRQDANPFDYAYCITAHKSQGDEFGSVIAIEEICDKWDHTRWAYTVASRAKNSLIWAAAPRFWPSYL